jgi:hypothetical protein
MNRNGQSNPRQRAGTILQLLGGERGMLVEDPVSVFGLQSKSRKTEPQPSVTSSGDNRTPFELILSQESLVANRACDD